MKKPTIIVLVATLMLAEGLLLMQVTSARPAWWDTDWANRRPITVGAHPENYQIKIVIPSDIDNSEYPSIRFLENETSGLLPYWIERKEGSYSENMNVAWVRRLENSDSTIWMYYRNPSATSAENGDNVFLFFDDFGGNANSGRWGETDSGKTDWYQYRVRLHEGAALEHGPGQSIQYLDTRRVIEFRMRNDDTQRGGLVLTGTNWNIETACIFQKGGGEYRMWSYGCGGDDGGYVSRNNYPENKWYVLRVDLYGDSKDKRKATFYYGEDNQNYRTQIEQTIEMTKNWASGDIVDKYNLKTWDSGSWYSFDWFFVRKYADPEPSVEVGPEQSFPGKPLLYSPPDGTTIYDSTPTFEWTVGENATNHRLLVDNDPDFSSPEENVLLGGSDNTYTPTTPLSPDNYSWKVIAIEAYVSRETKSSVWTFVVAKCGVEVTIENKFNEGTPCTWVTFDVIVHNTGTIVDNYHLTALDGIWPPENIILDPENLENVPPSESRVVKLYVHIPSWAELCTYKEIIVIAESMTCGASDNDNATIHVVVLEPWTGWATFKLENLYKVSLEKDLQLNTGSKLVVKFYKYDGVTLDNQSAIDNFVPPKTILENENVPHPAGLPVEITRLVLTTDNMEEVISTIASFTATKSVLASRYLKIKLEYVKPGADKPALASEYLKIKTQYIKAPY